MNKIKQNEWSWPLYIVTTIEDPIVLFCIQSVSLWAITIASTLTGWRVHDFLPLLILRHLFASS